MNSLALAESSPDAYAVELTPGASLALMRMPPPTAARLRRRLQEIAEVAAVAGDLGFRVLNGADSTLRLEVEGYVTSYIVDDARRELAVLSVVRVADE